MSPSPARSPPFAYIESLVAATERGRKQARDDDVEEGWHRFVAEKSAEDLIWNISRM